MQAVQAQGRRRPPRPNRRRRRPPAPAEAAQLDGLALAWAVFKNWLRSLFGAQTRMTAPRRALDLAALQQQLGDAGYIAEPALVAALLLMQDLGRPLLLEGDAGVGKTEVAKVLAAVRGTRLIRLQCYEGLDAHAAMYEWNYQRQLLAIKLLEQDDARAWRRRSRTSSPSATCSSARCWKPSAATSRRCC